MANPNKKEDKKEETGIIMKTTEFKQVALALHKSPTTGEFSLIKVKFDVTTGTPGEIETTPLGRERMEATYRFKIAAAELEYV